MLGTFPHGIGFLIAFVFFAPSLYIVQHMPPPFNFSGDIPRHGETGAMVEIVVLQILILGTIIFALLAFNAWLSPKLTQGPK